jgi:uncharacterized protein (DUF885 family)
MRFLICLLTVAMLIPATVAAANPAADLEARRKALHDLLHERWEYTMRTSPIYASILGDKRYNDKLDDFSQQAIDDDLEQTRRFLDHFEAIDTAGLPEQEALNKQLMIRDLKMALEGARFKPWEMPVQRNSYRRAATGQRSFVRECEGLRRLHHAPEATSDFVRSDHCADA